LPRYYYDLRRRVPIRTFSGSPADPAVDNIDKCDAAKPPTANRPRYPAGFFIKDLKLMTKLRPEYTIERLHERQQGRLPGLLGLRVLSLEEGMLSAELTVRDELLAPNGFLHAATVIGLADTACGYACLAHLPETARNFTTIELKSNFLGTATEGTIRAVAKGVHLGRSTQVWDATVTDPNGKTMALFRCTQMVLY
jgi:1,4-dihydroxy-2-naphthoyl-CoA hydrolase